MKFSKIDRDLKTREYFDRYYHWLINKGDKKQLFDIDQEIQAKEIELHLENHPEVQDQNKETINWVIKNAGKFRNFINSVKELAIFMYFIQNVDPECNNEKFDENYDKMIELYNDLKDNLIDSIY